MRGRDTRNADERVEVIDELNREIAHNMLADGSIEENAYNAVLEAGRGSLLEYLLDIGDTAEKRKRVVLGLIGLAHDLLDPDVYEFPNEDME